MNVRHTFKHMSASPALRQAAADRFVESASRFCDGNSWACFTYSMEHGQAQIHLEVSPGHGGQINASATNDSMYAALDQVVEKALSILKSKKEKEDEHRDHNSIRFRTSDGGEEVEVPMSAEEVVASERLRKVKEATLDNEAFYHLDLLEVRASYSTGGRR